MSAFNICVWIVKKVGTNEFIDCGVTNDPWNVKISIYEHFNIGDDSKYKLIDRSLEKIISEWLGENDYIVIVKEFQENLDNFF